MKSLKSTAILSSNTNNASFTDCSVWYYAKKTNGRLLTGDNKLRKSAEKDNVKVSGILYVFDNLIEYGIIDEKKALCIKTRDFLWKNAEIESQAGLIIEFIKYSYT